MAVALRLVVEERLEIEQEAGCIVVLQVKEHICWIAVAQRGERCTVMLLQEWLQEE